MASAVIRGIAARGPKEWELFGYNPHEEKLHALQRELNITGVSGNQALCRECDAIVLAVKPQKTEEVLREIAEDIKGKFLISVAAGKTLDYFRERVDCAVCRTAPNINAKIGASVTGLCFSEDADEEERSLARAIFETVGSVIEVPEAYMRIVSAVGGAAPAYTYMYINALAEAALKAGMPKQLALRLAAESVKGSAELVLASGEHPYALVDQVTSPGGSTVEGLMVLQERGFEYAVEAAIEAVMEKDKRF